ncbi:MAG: choline dehydrogenase [Bacteroidia bacterium]|nr:choline dehydrogenase [Bacteroidia bacterium]
MENTFDYVIIGAGSAGSVLANRLSANPANRVLLLEAGGKDSNPNIKIPAGFPKLFKSKEDWTYHTAPQKHLSDRELFLPRGKVLGGSSSINAMIYIRGNKADYDEWSAMGNKGWSYEEVLPYFKKSQHNEHIQNEYHGQGGPLNVQNRNYTNELSKVFVKAGQELGFTHNSDFNGEKQEGFGFYQVTHKKGSRWSAAHAFLNPAKSRSNLTVETHAHVHKIIIEDGVATGVKFSQKGNVREVKANKEVILSAGAYNSPQILNLSGVGDGADLQKHGIEVLHHLPGVGKNLQDHLVYFAIFNSNYKKSLDTAENFPAILGHLFNYLVNKQGPFNSNVGESGAFLKSPDESVIDTQYHFGPAYFREHGFIKAPKGTQGYSIGGKVLNPKSKGTVSLASANPEAAPIIDHNYLSDSDDVRKSIWGYKMAQKLGMTDAFKSYRVGMHEPSELMDDDKAIEDFIRSSVETLYHPTSTCKMGHDEMAVVDDELRVHGIKRLRVVDASIMPNVVRGNTNAPTYMIAEKAADMILASEKVTASTEMSSAAN